MTIDEKIQALYPMLDVNRALIYKDMGLDVIKNYLNTKESNDTLVEKYESALLQLIGNKVQSDSMNGVKSYTMSKTSVVYGEEKGFKITNDIKDLLPAPFVKLLG